MKRLLILVLSIGLLASCNNKKPAEKVGDKTTDIDKKDEKKDDMDGKDKTAETTTGWPKSDQDDFVKSCVTENVKISNDQAKSEKYCQCMLEKVEHDYPDVKEASKLTDTEVQDLINKYKDGCNQ